MSKKIIINTPRITIPAGVANHYLGLKPYFSNKVVYNQYLPGHFFKQKYGGSFAKLLRLPYFVFDILKFIYLIVVTGKPNVLLNPSFDKTALKRDALFLGIAKFFGCKVAVFIHGWNKEHLQKVLKNHKKFERQWIKADCFFVLANEFKNYLKELGIKVPIHLTTTKVNDQLIQGISLKNKNKVSTILFLARVEKAKGVFISLDAFRILKLKYPELKIRIVGNGNSLKDAMLNVENKKIKDVLFTGALSGESLSKEFLNADLYILPTTHGEGMPTSVLEAMAFGLPVISRPVGGLVDFFKNGEMGYLIESVSPEDYAAKIELLLNDEEKVAEISKNNAAYAQKHFMASKVVKNLEKVLESLN